MRRRKLLIRVVAAAFFGALIVFWFSRSPDPSVLLLDAAESGDLETVKTLIQRGTRINQKSPVKFGWTPLMGAIYHNETNVAYYLVESGADVNLADNSGETPLMSAIGHGDEAVPLVQFLINHGANLNAKDKWGSTPIAYARSDPPKPQLIALLEAAMREQKTNSSR